MTDFIFLGSKVTVDSNCSHETIRHWRKGLHISNLDFSDKAFHRWEKSGSMTPPPRMFPHFSKHTQRRTLEVTEVEDMLCGARDGDWEVRAGQRGPPHAPFHCGSQPARPWVHTQIQWVLRCQRALSLDCSPVWSNQYYQVTLSWAGMRNFIERCICALRATSERPRW